MSYAGDERWPTCQAYADWASAQGCAIAITHREQGARRFVAMTVTAPSGRSVTELATDMADPLASTTVARLDRRLGLKSAFFR